MPKPKKEIRKRKKRKTKFPDKNKSPEISSISKMSYLRNLLTLFSKSYKIYIAITAIATGILLRDQIIDFFKSGKQLWTEKEFRHGVYLPFLVNDSQLVTINIGENRFFFSQASLKMGVDVPGGAGRLGIFAKLMDKRVYVSTYFREINSENIIGDMDFNEWKIKSDKIYDYDEDDKLEIMDENGYVMFSMNNIPQTNTIRIRGYFILNGCINVVDNGIIVFTSSSKKDAIGFIKQIRPLKSIIRATKF
jgi:hypothetical protein